MEGSFHSHNRTHPEMKTLQGRKTKIFTIIKGKKVSISKLVIFFVQTFGTEQEKVFAFESAIGRFLFVRRTLDFDGGMLILNGGASLRVSPM